MLNFRRLIVCFLFGLLACPVFAGVQVEPHQTWYVLQIEGKKAGYMHTQLAREQQTWVSTTKVFMEMARGAVTIQVEQGSRFVESLDFEPIEATSTMKLATMAQETHIKFGGDKWEITEVSFGGNKTRSVDAPEQDWLTPVGLYIAMEKAIQADHETIEVTTLDLSSGLQPITMTMKKIEQGEVEVFGKVVPATKWSTTMSNLPEAEALQWVDLQGQMVRQNLKLIPGMEMTMLLADEQLAKAEFDAPEMLAQTLITPSKPIKQPRDLKKARFELSSPGLKQRVDAAPEAAAFQKSKWINDDTLLVEIDLTGKPIVSNPPSREYSAASAVLDSEDPEIVALTMQSLRALGEAEVLEQARAIRSFVREFIDEKNLSVGFATASEVARTAEGDCSEHAVLTAAMLRTAGIPSRTVTGLVYADQFAGHEGVFGFHMWAQAYIHTDAGKGYWLDLDAAAPGNIDAFDATHIALTHSSMSGDAMTNEMVKLLPLMQGIEIKLLDE